MGELFNVEVQCCRENELWMILGGKNAEETLYFMKHKTPIPCKDGENEEVGRIYRKIS